MHRGILFSALAIVLTTGCAHQQLRFNTVHHAETLTDLYEEQVLNNLARFVEHPETVPHFEIPTSGGTNSTDMLGLSANPINSFRTAFGLTGNRTNLNSWTLQPVSNPDRLRRMKCAFQRAVHYRSPNCKDCCELERSFIDTPTVHVGPVFQADGHILIDPTTNQPYADFTTLQSVPAYDADGALLLDANGNPRTASVYRPVSANQGDPLYPELTLRYEVEDGVETENFVYIYEYTQGVVTDVVRSPYDCNSRCAVQPCWFKTSCRLRDVKASGHERFGRYKNRYVWVPRHGEAEFGKLVMTIIEYALTDPPAEATKQVTLYLGHDGLPANREMASQVIQRTVPATSNNIALEAGAIDSGRSPQRLAELLDLVITNDEEKLTEEKESVTRTNARVEQEIENVEAIIREATSEKFNASRFKLLQEDIRSPQIAGLARQCLDCLENKTHEGAGAKLNESLSQLKTIDNEFKQKSRELKSKLVEIDKNQKSLLDRRIEIQELKSETNKQMTEQRKGRAVREANRIQQRAPKRVRAPRADQFREIQLQQDILLP